MIHGMVIAMDVVGFIIPILSFGLPPSKIAPRGLRCGSSYVATCPLRARRQTKVDGMRMMVVRTSVITITAIKNPVHDIHNIINVDASITIEIT